MNQQEKSYYKMKVYLQEVTDEKFEDLETETFCKEIKDT